MSDSPAVAHRSRNAESTRAAILKAAETLFARSGYEQVGVRDIAADAGIDPALVNRYFGSKEGLFVAVLESLTKAPLALRPISREFGEELASIVLGLVGEHNRRQLTALDLAIRSTNSPTAKTIVRDDLEERFVRPLVERFGGGDDASARAHVCLAVIMGMGVMRGMLGEEGPSLQMRREMIEHLAPVFDRLARAAD